MLKFCQLPVWNINLRHLCRESNGGQRCSFLECSIKMRSPCHFRVGLLLSQGETWSVSRVGVCRPTVCGSLICTLLTLFFRDPEKSELKETCLTNGAILLTVLLSQNSFVSHSPDCLNLCSTMPQHKVRISWNVLHSSQQKYFILVFFFHQLLCFSDFSCLFCFLMANMPRIYSLQRKSIKAFQFSSLYSSYLFL